LKKRRILGIITLLAAVPALAFLGFFVLSYSPPISHWLVWEKVAIGFFCLIGGIMLWKGNIWGYILSALGWGLIIFVHSSILLAYYTGLDKLKLTGYLAGVWLSVVFILSGSLIIFILLHDIWKKKHKAGHHVSGIRSQV